MRDILLLLEKLRARLNSLEPGTTESMDISKCLDIIIVEFYKMKGQQIEGQK